jgi:hypothetical protein
MAVLKAVKLRGLLYKQDLGQIPVQTPQSENRVGPVGHEPQYAAFSFAFIIPFMLNFYLYSLRSRDE